MSTDRSQSATGSAAPLILQCRHAEKDPVEEIIEVLSKETQSESFRVGGSVTSHHRRTQIILDNSSTRVLNILEEEDEKTPCSSGSTRFIDFGFLTGKPFRTFLAMRTIFVKYREKVNIVNISQVTLAKLSPNHLTRRERAFIKR